MVPYALSRRRYFSPFAWGLLLVAVLASESGSHASDGASTASPALQAFLERGPQPPLTSTAYRRLEAAAPRLKKSAWLDARVVIDPARGLVYEVLAEEGSGFIRNRVLRAALETESRAVTRSPTLASITTDNYAITDAGPDHEGLVRLRIVPKRSDQLLVDGFVIVAPETAEVVRIEGRMMKTPSFWITRVEVVRRYAVIDGFNVPIELSSRAQMRFLGASTFRMQYRYDSIAGTPVSAQPALEDTPGVEPGQDAPEAGPALPGETP